MLRNKGGFRVGCTPLKDPPPPKKNMMFLWQYCIRGFKIYSIVVENRIWNVSYLKYIYIYTLTVVFEIDLYNTPLFHFNRGEAVATNLKSWSCPCGTLLISKRTSIYIYIHIYIIHTNIYEHNPGNTIPVKGTAHLQSHSFWMGIFSSRLEIFRIAQIAWLLPLPKGFARKIGHSCAHCLRE